jgi:hypothetical protein
MRLARDVQHSYENVEAQCPHCGEWSVYNIATDIRPKPPVVSGEVVCRKATCGQPFRLIGNANHPFEHLLWDAQRLLEENRHMPAVLMAAQAFEVFSGFYARRVLFYIPGKSEPDFRAVEPLAKRLDNAIDDFAFKRMVNLLLNLVIWSPRPSTFLESARLLSRLRALTQEPADSALSAHPNNALVPLLLAVKRSQVGPLRNRVVHNEAYRPSKSEATAVVMEAGDLLFPLSVHLGLFAEFDPLRPSA